MLEFKVWLKTFIQVEMILQNGNGSICYEQSGWKDSAHERLVDVLYKKPTGKVGGSGHAIDILLRWLGHVRHGSLRLWARAALEISFARNPNLLKQVPDARALPVPNINLRYRSDI